MKKRNKEKQNIAPLKTVTGIYAKLKTKTFIIYPTVLVLATYILLLFTKIIDITLINRENEYFSVVILQMMIFILPDRKSVV